MDVDCLTVVRDPLDSSLVPSPLKSKPQAGPLGFEVLRKPMDMGLSLLFWGFPLDAVPAPT